MSTRHVLLVICSLFFALKFFIQTRMIVVIKIMLDIVIEINVLKTNLSTGISPILIMGLIGKDIFFDIREDDAFEVFHLPLFA